MDVLEESFSGEIRMRRDVVWLQFRAALVDNISTVKSEVSSLGTERETETDRQSDIILFCDHNMII